jgi:pyrrolidone-carboxylate peptidase
MVNVIGAALGQPGGAALEALDALRRERWRPDGADLALLAVAPRWSGAAEEIAAAVAGADAVLLLGEGAADAASAPRYAANLADPAARDLAGLAWPGAEIAPRAAASMAVTLGAARLARAVALAGLPCSDIAHGSGDVANLCLFRLLMRRAAPRIGLILMPPTIESARRLGTIGRVNRMQNLNGLKAAFAFAAAAAEAGLSGQDEDESLTPANGTPRRAHLR